MKRLPLVAGQCGAAEWRGLGSTCDLQVRGRCGQGQALGRRDSRLASRRVRHIATLARESIARGRRGECRGMSVREPFSLCTVTRGKREPRRRLPPPFQQYSRMENLLQTYKAELSKRFIPCKMMILRGDPKMALVGKADEQRADMMIMGSRPMGAIKK